jgi:hypothetical protein
MSDSGPLPRLALDDRSNPVLQRPAVPEAPAAIEPLEWARRSDAIREAAREFEALSDQDIRERLKGTTSRPLTIDEIVTFRQDVQDQVLDDLVDVLDQNRRGSLRRRRRVRVTAPRGYVKMTVRGLSDTDLTDVEARLRARGWTDHDVSSGLMVHRPTK